ncbi:GEVED domain-containing protein [Tenacibaculum tangerinum]|uniref:GEVED domain-containing protein n=1 Tax=Tenacibaculum tangerinum TaxID=3038772 RepID=A0ABY8L3C3_9FLAO|nr:GEVED domain-containing protein [Tenacibaculum tangerinum]WGH74504.1 GEVED domain-containing protein [Tenacibaculum tangerinum]
MKNKITLALLCFSLVFAAQSQQKTTQVKRNCNVTELFNAKVAKNPSLAKHMEQIELFTQRKIEEMSNKQGKISGDIYQIPVVVHLLYTNSTNNISVAQIQSQIDVLNEDFRRTNADATNKWSQAADTKIEFYLAQIDPNGNPTTGITRKAVSKSTWQTDDSMKKSSQGGVNPWNTAEYLNMWIVDNLISGTRTILGYAQFPWDTDASTDGVVMADQYFGTIGTAQAPFDGGRTTTHEVGHYFGLRHIWGDGGCGVDDFVSDTPESDAPNYGCATGHISCGSEDMVQNYMDYSDDSCMNLFTLGQKNRMHTYLETGGARRSLALSDKTSGATSCTATVPTGVTISGVTSSGATVSWTAVSGATYDVRYRQTGTSTWATSAVSGTSTSLSGLSASTQYEVQVRSKCSDGTTSAYSTSSNFTTPAVTISYCSSKGNSVADEYIGRVQLGTINNSSGGGNGYTDYTNISTNLAKSTSHTITITPTWTGTVYNEGYGVWIDYNQDGDFSDAGETVWTKSPSQTTPVSTSFTVPSGALEGATRMRIVMKYNATPTACEATFSYGEVEDYTVVIGAGTADTQAPSAPTNLTAGNVTQTTLTLSWSASTDNVGVTGYDVYRGTTKIATVTGTSASVTGLAASTTYSFSVRAKDAAGNVSSSSNTINVTTLSNTVSYCGSQGNNSSYEWIDNVELGGMTNATGDNGGYADFTSKTATLSQGSSNQMIVSAGFSSSSYTEYWAVWIDFNQNGTFESSEKVVSGSSSSANNLTATVNVPSGASLGTTRMRVSMKYNSAQTSCEAFSYGEVEDYTVNIVSGAREYNAVSSGERLGNESNLDLMAYPNPAVDYLQVRLASKTDKMTYKIVNTIGKVVKYGRLNNSNINVSGLQTGMYILEVNDGQKLLTTKVFKK